MGERVQGLPQGSTLPVAEFRKEKSAEGVKGVGDALRLTGRDVV